MGIIGAIAVPHPPLIVPAVGCGDQRRIQSTIDAYEQATRDILDLEPECIVITSPHAPLFRDGFHVTTDARLEGDMARFRAPGERISATCDVELARTIIASCAEAGIPAVGSDRYHEDMDHATYVPLHFVREEWRKRNPDAADDLPCPIVRIGARMENLIPCLNINPAIDEIVRIETAWQDAVRARYPHLMDGRPDTGICKAEFDVYLRCELETYSRRTLRLYLANDRDFLARGVNQAEEKYRIIVRKLGYSSLEEAEMGQLQ